MKHEWRKLEKNIYLPKTSPEIIEIPEFNYFTIKGEGNPNDKFFESYISVLYNLSYSARMSYKWENPPKQYYEYTVYPLEGVWDLIDIKKNNNESIDKNNLSFELMIRQPSFITDTFAKELIEIVKRKKPDQLLEKVEFKTIHEGMSVQMLHVGSFDNEPESFKIMKLFCEENNLFRKSMKHKEIYLSDVRKTVPEKLKTVLRIKI